MAFIKENIRVIRFTAEIDFSDDTKYLTHMVRNILREHADWLDEVGPMNVSAEGEISHPTGMIKWRREE